MQKTTLLQLSGKLCMLFLFLTAQRCQTRHLIELTDIEINAKNGAILTNHLPRQSKPDHHLQGIVLQKYDINPKICIVKTLKECIK